MMNKKGLTVLVITVDTEMYMYVTKRILFQKTFKHFTAFNFYQRDAMKNIIIWLIC
jgi:hypothetical protein